MQDKFQKPVDLKEKLNKQNIFELEKIEKMEKARRLEKIAMKKNEMVQSRPAYAESSGAARGAIDAMFANNSKDGENNLHKIDRAEKSDNAFLLKIIILALIVVVIGVIWFFVANKNEKVAVVNEPKKEAWSAVMLVSGEVYYGLVGEIDKNPITINNVYYDYDQVNSDSTSGEKKETGSLRLVKRGKENYGPDGAMTIFQPQIKYIEALKEDSKVLRAILDHEGK